MLMNKITSITRNKIFSFLTNVNSNCSFSLATSFCYFGNHNCPDFLSRLYDLRVLPSYDSRVNDAYSDIYLHTVTNPSDYPYEWLFSDERLTLAKGSDEQLLNFLCEIFHPEVRDMQSMVKENPTESIGKAKELVESCCKTILDERGEDYSKNLPLTALVKQCMKLLKITPEDIDENIPEARTMKAILGNLSGITDGIAKLRSTYGGGHGKLATYRGLEERHAKLAMGSNITLVDFLWCSHERRPK